MLGAMFGLLGKWFVARMLLCWVFVIIALPVHAFEDVVGTVKPVRSKTQDIGRYKQHNIGITLEDFDFAANFFRFHVCFQIGCSQTAISQISPMQAQAVKYLFSQVESAQDERQAIQKAIGLLEYFVGRQPGINLWDDKAMNGVLEFPQSAQNDCVDESTNSMSYLFVLQNEGLLNYHQVQKIVRRSNFLLDQHFAATIQDKASGAIYVVDSWFMPNGYPALVMLLADWKDKKEDVLVDRVQRSLKPSYLNLLMSPAIKLQGIEDVKKHYE